MSNLAKVQTTGIQLNTVEDMNKMSEVLAKSGFFDDAKSAAQCFVKILAGKELGFPAFSSMTGIHIIKGKPAIGANLMAAKIKASGKYDYRIKTLTSELCEIEFFQGTESLGISSFSKADAVAAATQNMSKFARNMLFARAVSNGVRFYCPDVFLGAPVYTPEELGAEVDAEGNVIDVKNLNPSTLGSIIPEQPIRDWAFVKEKTGFTSDQIKDFAIKLNLPPAPSRQSISESDELFDHVLGQWAFNNFPVFNAYKHAENALKKLKAKLVDDVPDDELWDAWEAEVLARNDDAMPQPIENLRSANPEPIPALD
jgi:hypothetical protein